MTSSGDVRLTGTLAVATRDPFRSATAARQSAPPRQAPSTAPASARNRTVRDRRPPPDGAKSASASRPESMPSASRSFTMVRPSPVASASSERVRAAPERTSPTMRDRMKTSLADTSVTSGPYPLAETTRCRSVPDLVSSSFPSCAAPLRTTPTRSGAAAAVSTLQSAALEWRKVPVTRNLFISID